MQLEKSFIYLELFFILSDHVEVTQLWSHYIHTHTIFSTESDGSKTQLWKMGKCIYILINNINIELKRQ